MNATFFCNNCRDDRDFSFYNHGKTKHWECVTCGHVVREIQKKIEV